MRLEEVSHATSFKIRFQIYKQNYKYTVALASLLYRALIW